LCLFYFILRGSGYPIPLTSRGPVLLAAGTGASERKIFWRIIPIA
jgi:hypothetical protein